MPGKFIPLTDAMYDYVITQRSNVDDPILLSLFKETESLGEHGRLAIGPDQATLISLLVALIGTKWAVEVGTFTGISSIDLRLGDARRLLPHYKPQNLVDFVFIDADKESYDFYYETILPFVRPGGLILFDNMLRGGEVVHHVAKTRPINRAIDQLNRKIAADTRVQSVLVPMADGLVICRKLFVPGGDGRRMMESRR
jgi:caffeoyl-CoA O-methyltransferase